MNLMRRLYPLAGIFGSVLVATVGTSIAHAEDTSMASALSDGNQPAGVPHQKDAAQDIAVTGNIRYGRHNGHIGIVQIALTNHSEENHLLTGISSPACQSLVGRNSDQQSSKNTDALFTHLALPRNGTMVFLEGGYHLLCLEMKSGLKAGQDIPFTLNFLGGSTKNVTFKMIDHAQAPVPVSDSSAKISSKASP